MKKLVALLHRARPSVRRNVARQLLLAEVTAARPEIVKTLRLATGVAAAPSGRTDLPPCVPGCSPHVRGGDVDGRVRHSEAARLRAGGKRSRPSTT